MPVIKSVVKKTGKNGDFWICVIDGEEVLAFDSSVVAMEGKDCPVAIPSEVRSISTYQANISMAIYDNASQSLRKSGQFLR